jgi:hypothetical protein
MADDQQQPTTSDSAAPAAAKAKKEKPPALEDKPLPEFIQQHYLPTLKEALAQRGVASVDLKFEKSAIAVKGLTSAPACSQVQGQMAGDAAKAFTIYFFDDSLQGAKGFTASQGGSRPSTLESFMIDERKVDLNLLMHYTLMRLNGQKWLDRN